LIESLNTTIKEGEDRTNLWTSFFTLRSSEEFISKWQQYLSHLQLKAEPIFYQHITLSVHDRLLHTRFSSADTDNTEAEVQFIYEEENTMRYMGSYVVKSYKLNMMWNS